MTRINSFNLKTIWGGSKLVRSVVCKAFTLAGKVKLWAFLSRLQWMPADLPPPFRWLVFMLQKHVRVHQFYHQKVTATTSCKNIAGYDSNSVNHNYFIASSFFKSTKGSLNASQLIELFDCVQVTIGRRFTHTWYKEDY